LRSILGRPGGFSATTITVNFTPLPIIR